MARIKSQGLHWLPIGIVSGIVIAFCVMMAMSVCKACKTEIVVRPEKEEITRARTRIANDETIDLHPSRLPVNVPTRGEAGEFQQVGMLIGEDGDDPIMLPLYGRQLYGRSDRWEYYTAAEKRNLWRIPVVFEGRDCGNPDVGCQQIYDGDEVHVPAYSTRSFKASIYKLRLRRYI